MSFSTSMDVKFDDQSGGSTAAVENTAAKISAEDGGCMKCMKARATHSSDPCRHYKVCAKCAMKMATGGKCKTCNNMYVSFRKIGKNVVDSDDDD